MDLSIEQIFGDNEAYRSFTAKVYSFAVAQVSRENMWSEQDKEAIAKDLTSDAILAFMNEVAKGTVISKRFPYVATIIINLMKSSGYTRMAERRKNNIIFMMAGKKHMNMNNQKNEFETMLETVDLFFNPPTQTSFDVSDFLLHNGLTKEEEEIAKLANEGYKGKEIARMLSMSESSISRAMDRIRYKIKNNTGNN